MGLFDFLKKRIDSEPAVRKVDLQDVENFPSLQQLLERYSGVAFEKQLAMSDSIGKLDWDVSNLLSQFKCWAVFRTNQTLGYGLGQTLRRRRFCKTYAYSTFR